MSASGGRLLPDTISKGSTVLIARVIAEPAGLSPQVDDLLEALGDEGFSGRPRNPGGVVEIAAEGVTVDILRKAIDKHLGTSDA
jgi:hypothetical protein